MADYKEQSISGNKWQRCRAVTINNPYQGGPRAFFQEEEVVSFAGSTVNRDVGSCDAVFDPVAGTIAMVDPTTNLPTGTTVTHAELYAILYSLYLQTATLRDAQ
jgi:hypothetical protein